LGLVQSNPSPQLSRQFKISLLLGQLCQNEQGLDTRSARLKLVQGVRHQEPLSPLANTWPTAGPGAGRLASWLARWYDKDTRKDAGLELRILNVFAKSVAMRLPSLMLT
jgi:hypothetical protein